MAKKLSKSFTLIELLVTLGISTVISTLIFFNYPQFSQNVSLRRTSDEIALTIREAQAYGLGVREFKGVITGGNKFPGYGVYFDTADQTNIVFFADGNNPNSAYDVGDGCGGVTTECVEKYKITTGDKVSKLCGTDSSGYENCGLDKLNIVFLRPNPTVSLRGVSGQWPYSNVTVTVKSTQGKEKVIRVWATGQISIENPI